MHILEPEEFLVIQFKNPQMLKAFKEAFYSGANKKDGVTICDNSKANTINITWDYQ